LHTASAIEIGFLPQNKISEGHNQSDYADTDEEGLAAGQHYHAHIGRDNLENDDPIAKTLEVETKGEAEDCRVPFAFEWEC